MKRIKPSLVVMAALAACGAHVLTMSVWATEPAAVTHGIPRHRTTSVDRASLFRRAPGAADTPVVLLSDGMPRSSHIFRNLVSAPVDRSHLAASGYTGFGSGGGAPGLSFNRHDSPYTELQPLETAYFALEDRLYVAAPPIRGLRDRSAARMTRTLWNRRRHIAPHVPPSGSRNRLRRYPPELPNRTPPLSRVRRRL